MKDWDKVSEIVDQALDVSPDERLTFINDTCAGDPELKENVVHFLENIDSSAGLWDKLFDVKSSLANEMAATEGDLDTDSIKTGPEQAGAYKIIRLIAGGGMGKVYLAERADGQFDRKVAIKVLRHELTSEHYIRRFSAERNILSGLEHPNIARLYDGGITEDNRPYLVMEYVDGLPISDYCQKNRCSLSEILDLFRQVCEAVEFAHRNLIVHRDLKPGNILVKPDGTVKVLDFGIAKTISDELTADAPEQTRENRQMMSLQYAAPEQITLEKITTATDVYALGLLLYELITGKPPYRLKGKSLREAEQIIRKGEVPKPGTQIADSVLAKKVKGDLDAIILTALQKEPEDRYSGAKQMLDDILRHRANRPVSARAGSFRYRFAKYVKRRPWAVAAGIAGILAILGYIITLLFYTERLERERNAAQLEAEKAAQISNFVVMLFEANHPDIHEGEIPSVLELLERGVERAELLSDQPEVSAQMLDTIGRMYAQLGRYREAKPVFKQTVTLWQAANPEPSSELGVALGRYGDAFLRIGYYDDAEPLLMDALEVAATVEDYVLKADILNDLGLVEYGRGNHEISEEYHRRALELRIEQKGEAHHRVGTSWNNLALALEGQFRLEEAEEKYLVALDVKRSALGDMNSSVTNTMRQLGRIYSETERWEEAEQMLSDALEINRQRLGNEHPRIAEDLNDLAAMYSRQGDDAGAEIMFREALAIREAALEEHSLDTAISLANLATVLSQQGKHEEARPLGERAVRIARDRWGENHLHTAIFILNSGSHYKGLEQYEEAEKRYRESMEMMDRAIPSDNPLQARPMLRLGKLLTLTGRADEAEEWLRKALELRIQTERPAAEISETEFYLGKALMELNRHSEAQTLLINARDTRISLFGEDHRSVEEIQTYLDLVEGRE